MKFDIGNMFSYIINYQTKLNNAPPDELEHILEKFTKSIKANILKYRLEKIGVDLDDVLQEVQIKIWKRLANEKKVLHYSSYINRIVNSTLIDFIRKSKRQEKLIYQEKEKRRLEKESKHEDAYENLALREIISEAADTLIESRRKVVKLFLLDIPIEEISVVLGWSKDKTRNLLYRGLSDMKGKLKEKGIEYEDR